MSSVPAKFSPPHAMSVTPEEEMRAAPNSETDQVKSGETMDNQGSSQNRLTRLWCSMLRLCCQNLGDHTQVWIRGSKIQVPVLEKAVREGAV
ncbi:hypothetical protein WR25_21974 [Diploscapter pachys]|uniref:Uncharacterized protein n=1 Tax=Diploscapter pachys TaxID=2018661 RepID=A0A2A2L9G3_9BILA|nr:hypothetical protein WR25_21974 [Diploscapter pachys]